MKQGQASSLTHIYVHNGNYSPLTLQAVGYANANYTNPNTTSTAADVTIDLNQWHYVNAVDGYAMWDMDLSVAADYVTLYGIEFQEVAGMWAFRATKTPDNVTRAAFPLSVKTIAKNGTYNETKLVVGISSKISEGVTYDAVSHELSENNANKAYDVNFFSIDMAKFKNNMSAADLATWNIKADGIKATILNANKQAITAPTAGYGITPVLVSELKGSWSANVGKTTTPAGATNLVFLIDNAQAATALGADAAGKQFST